MKRVHLLNFSRIYIGVATVLVILSLLIISIIFAMYKNNNASSSDENILVAFDREQLTVTSTNYTSLVIGPDWRLYGSTVMGEIFTWDIEEDGTLTNERLIYTHSGTIIIGLAFDPASTPDNPIIWFSENIGMQGVPPVFSGKINRLIVTDYATEIEIWEASPVVIGLPRSVIDHLVNSMAFGPDGALYIAVGSNSTMGGRDETWGMRPETLLGGSILRLDTVSLLQQGNLPLNVATGIPEEDGITLLDEYNFGFGDPELANLYDPQAPNAPLTIYATGLRNQYDLVWHSNGHLYVPVNGSANGGNVPGTPSQLPFSCQYRVDSLLYGPYTGPMVSPQTDLVVQPDLLVDIVEGGYYGHPNPTRCEWIAYGGNPTSQADRGQVGDHYPIGTLPDRNWRGYIFDFGTHQSPNGIITYQSNVFEGQLQGKLLVTRYSAGNDILVLELGGENGDVIGFHESIPGLAHLNSPLDLTEDVRNGNLYVSEFGARTISLLRPINDLTPAQITHLRRQTATLKLNTAFVIGFSLVLFAGTMSLGTGFILIRHYLQREKPAGHWNGFLSTTIIAGVIVIGLLSVAFYPLRKGWREFRQQLVTIQSVQLHPEEQVSTQLAPIEGTPIVRSYDPAEIEIGREIFRLNCASCHGDSGAGDTGIGVRLVNNSYILYHEDDELVEFLTTGRLPWDTDNRTGMTMPAKGGNPNLTEEDLRYLVAYLRTLNQQE